MNNKSNIASDKTDSGPFVIEEGKNKTRVEKAAEDVVVSPMPSKATTTVIESKGKNVEEEAIGVAVVREEEQNGGKNIEAAVAPIPAPPPPPSAVTRAVALQSLTTKKESFKSLPNANQSAFWLKKCNAALAVGDEGGGVFSFTHGHFEKGATDEGVVREAERVSDDENERSDRGVAEDRRQENERKKKKLRRRKRKKLRKRRKLLMTIRTPRLARRRPRRSLSLRPFKSRNGRFRESSH